MPDQRPYDPARLVAPIALAVVAIAFFGVLFTSGSGDDSPGGETAPERRSGEPRDRDGDRPRERGPRSPTYTVRTGDTLARIAERTNVSVERLQELNPDLDPQALVSGQTIKLRE